MVILSFWKMSRGLDLLRNDFQEFYIRIFIYTYTILMIVLWNVESSIIRCSMENPLYERISCKSTFQRATDLVIFFLLLSLLVYRLQFLNDHDLPWFIAFLCEIWFTFIWTLTMNAKWNPVEFRTHPNHLLSRVHELPPVDLFVTTADPVLEPPIITVNTVLSLLTLDYPANKLACYVSDDGASPLTYYALVEGLEFAKHWVPFCKKYNVSVRAPFRYFSAKENEACGDEVSSLFQQDWMLMKNKYEELCRKIEGATTNSDLFDSIGDEFADFSKIDQRNHPSIVKVIWENKEDLTDGVPHLVYVSREKRPKHLHHFKAGAMNVLMRVSGIMTNAPYILNVDCDMFANNPKIVLHAMCLLLEGKKEFAFVQFPQCFYGFIKDDPSGNQNKAVFREVIVRGIAGIQGIFYAGSGCFHRREVLYGLSPFESKIKANISSLANGFGNSVELASSAAQVLFGKHENMIDPSKDISTSLQAAIEVADCTYESDTLWGTKIGLVYGSTTEDVLTGLGIHAKGWQTAFCTPEPPGFLGCAPVDGPASMIQKKRWATGLLEVLFCKNSPIITTINQNLQFRQCLAYLNLIMWGPSSIPELCYSLLPAYCFLTNTSFIPKVSDISILIPALLFIIYNLQTMSRFCHYGLSLRAWWNHQRMKRITTITTWTFSVIAVILKVIGVSDTIFEVTQKETNNDDKGNNVDPGRFTFNDSPMFLLGTSLVLAHITALFFGLVGMKLEEKNEHGPGLGEMICSAWVLLSFLPFVKGLYRKGKYGIPTSTICKAVALVGLFVQFCICASWN